ncbi:hypothetical protein AKJ49_00890 [candidate division MSBL1 archaeon SCGC-AAA382A03]|uniref:Uncharacterized protein n=1 Tax=candidate division MSBL1 archaeon SCGC-AAA382A03 TaxID=1698278 RepID=A0A133VG34_9EURY|nr:hypothetical protein AKJ49_00890 [candidate division MSBL1 archaeon SCGC-AAA382A03]
MWLLYTEKQEKTKSFEKDDLDVTVHLALYTEDKEEVPRGEHKRYWHDSIKSILATHGRKGKGSS